MAKRQWILNKKMEVLSTINSKFFLNRITEAAKIFLLCYGMKQYLSDAIAGMLGKEFSDSERAVAMDLKFQKLCSPDFEIIFREKDGKLTGFSFADPNKVTGKLTPLQKLERKEAKLRNEKGEQYKALINSGKFDKAQAEEFLAVIFNTQIKEVQGEIEKLKKEEEK